MPLILIFDVLAICTVILNFNEINVQPEGDPSPSSSMTSSLNHKQPQPLQNFDHHSTPPVLQSNVTVGENTQANPEHRVLCFDSHDEAKMDKVDEPKGTELSDSGQ